MNDEVKETSMDVLSEKAEEGTQKENYKLYKYLRDHPGLLVSGVSAITIALSFICNLAFRAYTNRYLSYWGIDPSVFTVEPINQINVIVVGCAMFYLGTIAMQWMAKVFEQYYKDAEGFLHFIYGNKLLKKQLKKAKRGMKPHEASDEIHIAEEITTESTKAIKATRWIYKRRLFSNAIVISGLVFVIVYGLIWLLGQNMKTWHVLLCVAAITVITVIITPYVMRGLPIKRKIKKRAKDTIKEPITEEEIKRFFRSDKPKYPLDKLLSLEVKDFFNKSTIIVVVLYAFMIPFYIAILLMTANREMTVDKDEFLTTVKNDKEYVLIYKDGSNYYLEEAEMGKNQISINTEKVKIISSDDIEFETMIFEEVERKQKE